MGRKKRSRKKQNEDRTTWPPDKNMSGWRKARRTAAQKALFVARRDLVRRDVRFLVVYSSNVNKQTFQDGLKNPFAPTVYP